MSRYSQFPVGREAIEVVGAAPAWAYPRKRSGGAARVLWYILAAIGLGVGVLFSALVGLVMIFGAYGTEVKLNGGSQLYYTSGVKEAEALKLADWFNVNLLNKPEATAQPRSFQLNKKGTAYELRVCVQPGKEKDQALVSAWQVESLVISEQVFNKAQVNIVLCDDHLNTVLAVPHLDTPPAAEKK